MKENTASKRGGGGQGGQGPHPALGLLRAGPSPERLPQLCMEALKLECPTARSQAMRQQCETTPHLRIKDVEVSSSVVHGCFNGQKDQLPLTY